MKKYILICLIASFGVGCMSTENICVTGLREESELCDTIFNENSMEASCEQQTGYVEGLGCISEYDDYLRCQLEEIRNSDSCQEFLGRNDCAAEEGRIQGCMDSNT